MSLAFYKLKTIQNISLRFGLCFALLFIGHIANSNENVREVNYVTNRLSFCVKKVNDSLKLKGKKLFFGNRNIPVSNESLSFLINTFHNKESADIMYADYKSVMRNKKARECFAIFLPSTGAAIQFVGFTGSRAMSVHGFSNDVLIGCMVTGLVLEAGGFLLFKFLFKNKHLKKLKHITELYNNG